MCCNRRSHKASTSAKISERFYAGYFEIPREQYTVYTLENTVNSPFILNLLKWFISNSYLQGFERVIFYIYFVVS